MRHRAAIVGLGRVGMLFDEDTSRRRVWTHFSSYERLADRFDLVAVCDPDADRCNAAISRRPSLRTFASLDELLDSEPVDVISICTPIDLHAKQILRCAGRVKAIICEKTISSDTVSGTQAADACNASGTLLAVNYYKRFEASVQRAHRLVGDGDLGDVRSASAVYSGPLDAVGSHAVDLLRFLLGSLEVASAADTSALFRATGNGVAALLHAGSRSDLVFEIDIIGTEGRARILENCGRLEVSRFAPSGRYDGYRELVDESSFTESSEPFLLLFTEVADALDGKRDGLTSDAPGALHTQRLLDTIHAQVRQP
jgi:predicted dehydrogenase